MVITKSQILCDRCGKEMATTYGKTWEFYKAKKAMFKIVHDIPAWNRTDTFHLCDECTDDFKKWMEG